MQERKKNIIKSVGFLLAGGCVGALVVWGLEAGKTEDLKSQSRLHLVDAEESQSLSPLVDADENEIYEETAVDYPFPYGIEDWRLVLCDENTTGEANSYSFRLYDGDENLLQEFPCSLEADELIFRYDSIYNYREDLAVFPADAAAEHTEGLLFEWDYSEHRFVEEPIVIPWYEKAGGYTFLVTDNKDNVETHTIYCINQKNRQPIELRTWTLSRSENEEDTAKLYIWDCLEEAVIYDGKVRFNKIGQLVNDDYYQDMFWKDMNRPWDITADTEIPTVKYGEDGKIGFETMTYESREALLADCGFQGAEPFYQYYDRFQNLELELYFDENEEKCCGFGYSHGFNYDLEKVVSCYGFIYEGVNIRKWEDDSFSILTCDGIDARNHKDITQVIYEYTDDAKLSSYEVRGITELTEAAWYEGIEVSDDMLLSIEWVYYNDGTLYRKYYYHNSMEFSTFDQSQHIYYDEMGRPVYRYEYITHGHIDNYYIYDGENDKPGYCILLDWNGGYAVPLMIAYK